MTTTNVPSDKFEDLKRDVEDATRYSNSTTPYTNRVGQQIRPIPLQTQDIADNITASEQALANSGFIPKGDFTTGGTVESKNEVFSDGTDYWRYDGALPFTVSAGSSPTPTGVGAWINVTDGTLRSQLAAADSSVLIGGQEARYIAPVAKLPFASRSGLGAAPNTPSQNASIIQNLIDSFGGLILDVDATYDITISLPANGAVIHATGGRRALTWNGADDTYAFNTALSGGSYQNDFYGFDLVSSTRLNNGIDLRKVRFSTFNHVRFRNCKIAALTNSNWNNSFYQCWFVNGFNDAGSIGIDFRFDATEPFNITNAATFQRCLFNLNDTGVRMEAGGDGVNFSNCGFEANNRYAMEFVGQGGCHNLVINNGCYIEGNKLGSFLWDKNGAGSFYGVSIENNYIGTESTARAGIIEFVSSNGGTHSIKIANNTFRNFNGNPSTGLMLDVNGATMSNIYIEWFNNGFGTTGVNAFDKNAVDWRYIKTDVTLQLTYATNPTTSNVFVPDYEGGEITINVTDFGQAVIQGTFKDSSNTFNGAINVTDAIPITLRPQGLLQVPAFKKTDANSEGTPCTVMMNGGQVRTLNLGGDAVSFSAGYQLQRERVLSIQ